MVSTLKKKNQQKKQFIQLNKILNDFVLGSKNKACVIENEFLESPTDGHYSNPEIIVDGEISACQNQVIGNNIDDKIRKMVDNAIKTV